MATIFNSFTLGRDGLRNQNIILFLKELERFVDIEVGICLYLFEEHHDYAGPVCPKYKGTKGGGNAIIQTKILS